MPLDSSGVTPIFGRNADGEPVTARERPTLDYGPDIGVALRNANVGTVIERGSLARRHGITVGGAPEDRRNST